MKKIDLIHTTILIIAILAGYEAIHYVISLLSLLAFLGDGPVFKRATEQLIFTLIAVGSFIAVCIVLVKNGRKYATLILKDDPEGSWEEAPKWDLDRKNILLALFIGIGLYTMVQAIPGLIQDLYTLFQEKVNISIPDMTGRKDTVIIELLKTLFGFFLIYASPALTNYIDKTIAVRLGSGNDKT